MLRAFVLLFVLGIGALAVTAQERPAFIIAQLTVTDPDRYSEYGARFGPIFEQHEGEVVAFSEDPTVLEGEWPATRTVVIRFPSRAKALEWYDSDEYQQIIPIRQSASNGPLVLLDGR